jgi:hypothetical protein
MLISGMGGQGVWQLTELGVAVLLSAAIKFAKKGAGVRAYAVVGISAVPLSADLETLFCEAESLSLYMRQSTEWQRWIESGTTLLYARFCTSPCTKLASLIRIYMILKYLAPQECGFTTFSLKIP